MNTVNKNQPSENRIIKELEKKIERMKRAHEKLLNDQSAFGSC